MGSHHVALTLIFCGLLAGCATPPVSEVHLDPGANIVREISITEQEQSALKKQNAELLAPRAMRFAEKSLAKAQELHLKGAAPDLLVAQVERARSWNQDAFAALNKVTPELTEVLEARQRAQDASAPQLMSPRWQKADEELQRWAESFNPPVSTRDESKLDALTENYLRLEAEATAHAHLGPIEQNLKQVRKDGASHFAPRTLKKAQTQLQESRTQILEHPHDSALVDQVTREAGRMVGRLVQVNRQVKFQDDATSEDTALAEIMKNENQISNFAKPTPSASGVQRASRREDERRVASLEAAFATGDAHPTPEATPLDLPKKAAKVRQFFNRGDAEVHVQPPFILVRLRGLQFRGLETNLTPAEFPLLEKVKAAIASLGARRVVVEGHTDRHDSANRNQVLSNERAEAVKNYLLTDDDLPTDEITAMGYGSDRPLDSSDSAEARNKNRRIDLLIEPQ